MTNKTLSWAAGAVLLLLCSVSSSPRSRQESDPSVRTEGLHMKEMEQNYANTFQSEPVQWRLEREKKNLQSRERRQVGDQDDLGSGDSEPLLTEDPKGWGLAHVLG